MVRDVQELIESGGAALTKGDWDTAGEHFAEALSINESPEAHAGLSEAEWWRGRLNAAIDHREKAYAGFREQADLENAFMVGLLMVFDYQGHVGNYVASSGWLARLERMVEENDLDELQGWLLLANANEDIEPVRGEGLARQALEFAKKTADVDLEICALSQIGSCLVAQGKTDEGIALLDEAMAGSLGGEVESRDIVVLTSCKMMVSCIGIGDFDRATKWVHAADRFVARYGCPFLYAECRTIYGSVLVSTGDWEGAERELLTAIETARDAVPVFEAQARSTLAHLRLCQGKHADARRLVSGIEEHPWAVPVVAQLHLRAGRDEAAASVLQRRLTAEGAGLVERSRLDELMGEAELMSDRSENAVRRARTLGAAGESSDSTVVVARAERLLGRALAEQAEHSAAIEHFEAALGAFSELNMVYEVALTRTAMGVAISQENSDAGAAELQAALYSLDRIGADHDADLAAGLLRDLGVNVRFRGGSRAEGLLTKREEQVLELVGEGLTNPEIADRLFISRKTVEHHVARILAKLGVRNRVEAAEAARRLETKWVGE